METIIQDYWDNRADTYSEMINEDMNSFKRKCWSEIISNKMGNRKDIRALDIGTGPGFFAIIMAQMGYEVTAVDGSCTMIKEARENAEVAGTNINFIKGDVENLNLSPERFDLIISRNVTWTLKNPVRTYENWFKLLRPEGKLIIFDANWYLRLSCPELQEQYVKDMDEALKLGYDCKTYEKQRKICEDIARDLPLTYELRPAWDEKVLMKCGFSKVDLENDISEKIYTEEEKTAYRSTPMFSICACKL
ncbi:class I SAM-dependent methyltransferase [Clostridium sp. JNZ X4-2]